MTSSHLSENSPILVAAAAVSQKIDNPEQLVVGLDAIDLMTQACRQAATNIQCPEIIQQIQDIAAPQGMWPYNNPCHAVAEQLGITASTAFAKLGIVQQQLIARACQLIESGDKEVCVVTGGEAKYRELIASVNQINLPSRDPQPEPDTLLEPEVELWLEAETHVGLGMPVGYYALMDSAYRAKLQIGTESYRDQVADLYQRFSQIASHNPNAWKPKEIDASDIRNSSDSNPMLAFPYTKRHNTSWNVDQACALIFCSIKKARELGIDEKHWVYPAASTECNQMLAVSQRPDLGSCPGAKVAGDAALALSGINIDAIDLVELYSCFPIGVLSFKQALGINDQRDLTTTGGMPFAGGPLNNYVLQATVHTVNQMLEQGKTYGLVSTISGMNTKQAFGIYSLKPTAFNFEDVTAKVAEQNKARIVETSYNGQATIVAATVLYQNNTAQRAVIIADTDTGNRALAYSTDNAVMQHIELNNPVAEKVLITDAQFTLAGLS